MTVFSLMVMMVIVMVIMLVLVVQAVNAWAKHGFINYFGLQRFGCYAVGTHDVGRALLKVGIHTAKGSRRGWEGGTCVTRREPRRN